ncbi:MAG: class I SAM-dependent methyltransferase [Thermodesulfobacteriota bacterium]
MPLMEDYKINLEKIKKEALGFYIFEEPIFEEGAHPENFIDYECAFAAQHIKEAQPKSILDIGSYRHFILGLLAHFSVTTLDVRRRHCSLNSEIILIGDAQMIPLPPNSFDVVLSLCALEHFGLGRYGDNMDWQGDQKAFAEMRRVLKPKGRLIFSTTIHQAEPAIAFNAHRIYTYEMVQSFCRGMDCLEEKFYSHRQRSLCSFADITSDPKWWDVYLGCWQKNKKGT